MWKKYVLVILVAFVLTSWSIVYLAKGVISVIGWWSIQAFSIVSLFILIGVTLHAHQLKNFHYPQVTKNVILSKKLARKGDIFL